MRLRIIFIFALFLCVTSLGTVEDQVDVEQALQHVEALVEFSPRLAGSGTAEDEVIGGGYSAALYIAKKLKDYGYEVALEEFYITTFQIVEFVLLVDFDGDFETPDHLDLSKEAVPPTIRYLDITYDMVCPLRPVDEVTDTQGTVPGLEYWTFYDPESYDRAEHAAVSLVYKEHEPAFMPRFRDMVSISYEDYLLIKEHETEDTVVLVKLLSSSKEVTAYNVVGKKQGNQEKQVIVTAHYDSVYTDGAIDNGSGVAALLETARIMADKHIGATVYFVFFDAEEIGLLGSEAFVAAHTFSHAVCINVDSIASGDTVCVGGVPRYEDIWGSYYHTDAALDRTVAHIAENILGYSPQRMYLEDVGGYSDFVTFTREGIPTTDITTMDREAAEIPVISEERQSEHASIWVKGERVVYYDEDRFSKIIPYIHTGYDDLAHFDKELFYDTARVVAEATYQLSTMSEGKVTSRHVLFIAAAALFVCIIWYLRSWYR